MPELTAPSNDSMSGTGVGVAVGVVSGGGGAPVTVNTELTGPIVLVYLSVAVTVMVC